MISSFVMIASMISVPLAEADETNTVVSQDATSAQKAAPAKHTSYPKADSELGKRLNEQGTVFLSREDGCLWLKTTVAQQTGVLEMFLCRRATKEHESVVAVDSPAFVIHAGLLALGLEPGEPARFEPEFAPPTGAELSIKAHWIDSEEKRQSQQAGEWIRRVTQRWFTIPCEPGVVEGVEFPDDVDIRFIEDDNELIWYGPLDKGSETLLRSLSTKQAWQAKVGELKLATKVAPFDGRWIFAGSSFWVDGETGEKSYQAESGNLICVANFGDAMIDVDIESSAQNASLLFEPWTERVPARGTPVLLEIRGIMPANNARSK